MGVEYSAAIVVGARWRDTNGEDAEKLNDLLCYGKLEDFPPYYDGCNEGVFGIGIACSPDYSYKQISLSDERIEAAKKEFENLTGMTPSLYLTTVGT